MAVSLDDITQDPQKYIEEAAHYLSHNEYSAYPDDALRENILDAYKDSKLYDSLVQHVAKKLGNYATPGNIRFGAARLLGSITPEHMKHDIKKVLEDRLNDTYEREADTPFMADDEWNQTVGSAAYESLRKLN